MQLDKAEATIRHLEKDVRARIPRGECVLLHIEPAVLQRMGHVVPNVSARQGVQPSFPRLAAWQGDKGIIVGNGKECS